jgi:chromosome segregation ATPase
LQEERRIATTLAEERDQAEAKVFSLTRDMKEKNDRIEKLERQEKDDAAEIEQLMSSREKKKRMLDAKVEVLQNQIDELKDDSQTAKANFEREISACEKAANEKQRGLLRQLRDIKNLMEGDLEKGNYYIIYNL